MHLGADMMRHQPDDPLSITWRKPHAGIGLPGPEPVDPQSPVRVEHDLDNLWFAKGLHDPRSESCSQHARAAGLNGWGNWQGLHGRSPENRFGDE
jgi:hypothetical protein